MTSFGSFSYDGVFNMLGMSATYTGLSSFSGDTDWTYDTKDRLTQEASTRYGGWTDNNAFDSAFNPTTFKGNSRSYNSNNQLTTGSMTYDGNGNPTTYAGTSFTYDVENRITAVGSLLTNGYRADGLRAWKEGATGGKKYFLYDGSTPIIELDSSGNIENLNVFAPDGLVARKEGATWTYYTFDQQGNVAQRLNSSEVVQTSRVFDAWGEGAETTQPKSLDCWNYNGQWGYYYDRETTLYYCQNRMYDASTGRWINRDPIGYAGGINLYGYCGSGPVGAADPNGLAAVVGGGAVILLAVVAAGFLLMSSPQGQRSMELGADAAQRIFESIAGALQPRVPAADCGEEVIDVENWPTITGIPGTVQRGERQSRRYGPTGWPIADRDWDRTERPGIPRDHEHPWIPVPGRDRPERSRDHLPPGPDSPPVPRQHPDHNPSSSMGGEIFPGRGTFYR